MNDAPVFYAAATFFSTFLGGLFVLRYKGLLDRIMALSGGMLLTAGLLDLLPESVALHLRSIPGPATSDSILTPLRYAVIGFVVFYLLERMAILRSYHIHHPHAQGDEIDDPNHRSHGHGRRQIGILGAAGLCIHSFLDGFSIGMSFHVNSGLGVLVAMAVIAHDFSDGVTTVTLLISNQNSRRASIGWLVLDALAPLIGVAVAMPLHLPGAYLSNLLGIFAGMFLYLGCTHMLPEAHALSDSWVVVAWMLTGVAIVVFLTHFI